jgi:MarR family
VTRIEQRLWKRLESAFVCGKCPLQTWFALDDNAQSVAANIKVTPAKAKCQRVVLDVLRQYGPLTCKEIACQLDVEMPTISGRITELKEMGRVRATARTRDGGGSRCGDAQEQSLRDGGLSHEHPILQAVRRID